MIATRYPNRLPSDYVDGLDDWQAFQLDAALAVKYSLVEKDEKLDMLESIHGAIENLMRAQGAKIPKRKNRDRLVKVEEKKDEVPLIDDLLEAFAGGTSVININESELPKWQG